jgi:hypothetical protein
MTIALPLRALAPLPIFHPIGNRRSTFGSGLLQVLSNSSERKYAAAVALILFVASLALAPALTRARDQNKLASEINAKTLKAAAAIRMSPRLPLRVQN